MKKQVFECSQNRICNLDALAKGTELVTLNLSRNDLFVDEVFISFHTQQLLLIE